MIGVVMDSPENKGAIMCCGDPHDQVIKIQAVLFARNGFEAGQVGGTEEIMFIRFSKSLRGIPDKNLHSLIFGDTVGIRQQLAMFNPPTNETLARFRWVC